MSELENQRSRVHRQSRLHRRMTPHAYADRTKKNSGIMLVLTPLLTALACSIPAEEGRADVTIEGGMDQRDRHHYSWTVTNTNDETIVAVEIPHYRGLIFTIPAGWSKEVTEVETGSADVEVGRLLATAPKGGGIRRGQSATFSIQLHARGASAQRGQVVVTLADGTRVTISNVEYPGQEHWLTKYMTLVGMIGLVMIAVMVQLLRRTRTRRKAPSAT